MLELINVSFKYDQTWVLRSITLSVNQGEIIGVIGPNGSGKSTLLRLISGVLEPNEGQIDLMGKNLHKMSRKEIAKMIGVVPQNIQLSFPFTVREVVVMGRAPHLKWFQRENKTDFETVERALSYANMLDLADRMMDELSGGERQRAFIAKALAQEPKLLLLDEPIAHLDINYQFEILDLVRKLNRERGLTIILVSHDINLASEYCDRLAIFKAGELFAIGSAKEVITEENIMQGYGIPVIVTENPTSGMPMIIKGRRTKFKDR
jgi:iron complex transport system ATP-binding protein